MLLPFSRIVALAVLYLGLLTSAAPVAEDFTELNISGPLDAEHKQPVVDLSARTRSSRPKPRPKPKPGKVPIRKPVPTKTTIRRPAPTKTVIRKPAPTKTVIRKPVPTKTIIHKPVPTKAPAHPVPTTKRPAPAKPTTPVKRPTVVPKPPVKTTAAPSKTTSKTPTATPSKAPQCPVQKPVKGSKGPRALYEWAVSLFARTVTDVPLFIGWHGTNSNTSKLWEQEHYLARPPPAKSSWPWESGQVGGTSGADHELGLGVYITDTEATARSFASINARNNAGTEPRLCAIFAKSRTRWIAGINKVWIPNDKIRDSSTASLRRRYEAERVAWIKRLIPHSPGTDVARFGPLDKNRHGGPNQVVIPSALTHDFYADCVNSLAAVTPPGTDAHLNYTNERHPWNVRDRACE
ncbi:hypothetical protein AURDEDRAFT_173137 [Auricularia subglabra TFB-10046 SS5]|nr:hypothetical protein AURDEDRAFT_173137 [Auricularia subglabra TFB-10046 SS5]